MYTEPGYERMPWSGVTVPVSELPEYVQRAIATLMLLPARGEVAGLGMRGFISEQVDGFRKGVLFSGYAVEEVDNA